MTKIDELGWSRLDAELWEFRQGDVVWSTVVLTDDGWKAVSAVNVEGPYSDVGQAMDSAEDYWRRQDVGPLAEPQVQPDKPEVVQHAPREMTN